MFFREWTGGIFFVPNFFFDVVVSSNLLSFFFSGTLIKLFFRIAKFFSFSLARRLQFSWIFCFINISWMKNFYFCPLFSSYFIIVFVNQRSVEISRSLLEREIWGDFIFPRMHNFFERYVMFRDLPSLNYDLRKDILKVLFISIHLFSVIKVLVLKGNTWSSW